MREMFFKCWLVCGVIGSREWACAHPVEEASVLVGDTGNDGAATSSPHVFPTSLALSSPSRSLVLHTHVTRCSTSPLLPLDSFVCAGFLFGIDAHPCAHIRICVATAGQTVCNLEPAFKKVLER